MNLEDIEVDPNKLKVPTFLIKDVGIEKHH